MLLLPLTVALAVDLTVGPTGTYSTLDDALDDAVSGDRLLVDPGTYVEGQLAVDVRTITIEATAPGVVLHSTHNRRAFAVDGGDLTLIGLEVDLENDIGLLDLRTGRFEARDCTIVDAQAPIPGQPAASIDAQDGTIVLTDSVLDGAVAGNKEGGHIYALRTDVTITGSTLTGGSAPDGGTIYLDGGSLTVSDSTLGDDVGSGPAVWVRDATITLTDVTLTHATSGALSATDSTLDLTDTVFEANVGAVSLTGGALTATGGRFEANTGTDGVALLAEGASVTLDGVRFEANTASAGDVLRCDGGSSCTLLAPHLQGNSATGAVFLVRSSPAVLTGATACVHDATTTLMAVEGAGTLELTGSVVLANQLSGTALTVSAGSSATLVNNSLVLQEAGAHLIQADGALTLTNNLVATTTSSDHAVEALGGLFGGYNLYFGNSGGDLAIPLATDILGTDPLIGTPALGDCDVAVLAPRVGSPLIDAGDPSLTDVDGSPSDIGAFGGESPNPGDPTDPPDPKTEPPDPVDSDGDGVPTPEDCDDEDPDVYPGATEVSCNGLDDDCDPATVDAVDEDGDGVSSCEDCDDTDGSVSELVDVYLDNDRDGYGIGDPTPFCLPPTNSAPVDGDCDDTDPETFPGAPEIPYDDIDQDCDGFDLNDLDGDGAVGRDDCDDEDPERFPRNEDIPDDGIDQDCSGYDVETTLVGAAGWSCGCSNTGGSAGWWLLPLLAVVHRRRR